MRWGLEAVLPVEKYAATLTLCCDHAESLLVGEARVMMTCSHAAYLGEALRLLRLAKLPWR